MVGVMACNYLPDGCTQAALDAYYGCDEYDPRDDEPVEFWPQTEDDFSLLETDTGIRGIDL
jgi:hypothetical protein